MSVTRTILAADVTTLNVAAGADWRVQLPGVVCVDGRGGVISAQQDALLRDWLGEWQLVADHSWPLQDTTVLHVRNSTGDHMVKASSTSHHIRRELDAHRQFLNRLAIPVPQFEHGSARAGILVTRHVPGELVLGTRHEESPDVYTQAGAILRALQVPGAMSRDYVDDVIADARGALDVARGLMPEDQLTALRQFLDTMRPLPVRLHFTHGDYQPRNWLHHEGRISVIDFGRASQRSWVSDLVRLQNWQFVGRADLEDAFMGGMERALTDSDLTVLELETVRASIGTVVWAHRIGDAEFEQHGRDMVTRILARRRLR